MPCQGGGRKPLPASVFRLTYPRAAATSWHSSPPGTSYQGARRLLPWPCSAVSLFPPPAPPRHPPQMPTQVRHHAWGAMRNVGFLHAVCCHLPENCFKNTHTVAMPMAKATTECDGYSGGGGGRKAAAAAAAAATLTQRRRRRTSLLRPGQPPLLRDARDRKRCRVSKRAGSCPASPRGHWQVGPPPPPRPPDQENNRAAASTSLAPPGGS